MSWHKTFAISFFFFKCTVQKQTIIHYGRLLQNDNGIDERYNTQHQEFACKKQRKQQKTK